jgi:hypothetical protein
MFPLPVKYPRLVSGPIALPGRPAALRGGAAAKTGGGRPTASGPKKIPITPGGAPVKGGLDYYPQHFGVYPVLGKVPVNSRPLLLDAGKEKMLGSQEFAGHITGFLGGALQKFFSPFGGGYIAMDRYGGNTGYARFHSMAEFKQIDSQEHEGLTGNARPLFKKGNDHMLGEQLI